MHALLATATAIPVLGIRAFEPVPVGEDRGAGIVEYSAIGGLMLTAIVVAVGLLTGAVNALFVRLVADLLAIAP